MTVKADSSNQRQARNVFDVDYFGDAMPESQQPQRRLTAQEWEAKLREEDRASHVGRRRGKTRSEPPELPQEEPQTVSTRFGSFSGATEASSDAQEGSIVVAEGQKQKRIALPWSRPEEIEE